MSLSNGRAYTQPTQEGLDRILESMFWTEKLSNLGKGEVTESVREIRLELDGRIRGVVGTTNHYRGIRALCEPIDIQNNDYTNGNEFQLVGEELFGINRLLPGLIDLVDVVWWATYSDGSWDLEDWNPNGEHLSSRRDGELKGFSIKVNGILLYPSEVGSFYRTIRRREERDILSKYSLRENEITENIRNIHDGKNEDNNLSAFLRKFGFINGSGLTYVGSSLIIPQTAIERKKAIQDLQNGVEDSHEYFGIDLYDGRAARFLKCVDPTRFDGVGYAYC